jgi:hypothetical protein
MSTINAFSTLISTIIFGRQIRESVGDIILETRPTNNNGISGATLIGIAALITPFAWIIVNYHRFRHGRRLIMD